MLRKIILPVVLLIFTQQNFYGMEKKDINEGDGRVQVSIWVTINNWVNRDESNGKKYPKLWLLWAFLDNVPLQYGGSKIWKHGEAYYGLSNGIGFFTSFLNFGWLKIGFVDAHINIINAITNYIKIYVCKKYYYRLTSKQDKNKVVIDILWASLRDCLLLSVIEPGIHLFSIKFYNFVKIKIISLVSLVKYIKERNFPGNDGNSWYLMYATYSTSYYEEVSNLYRLLSPRIEINIPGIIKYLRGQ